VGFNAPHGSRVEFVSSERSDAHPAMNVGFIRRSSVVWVQQAQVRTLGLLNKA
jgi:hypothetical protein